jgi:hypothetical protein
MPAHEQSHGAACGQVTGRAMARHAASRVEPWATEQGAVKQDTAEQGAAEQGATDRRCRARQGVGDQAHGQARQDVTLRRRRVLHFL